MPFHESVAVAVSMLAIVFLVLIGLYLCIRFISWLFHIAVKKTIPEPVAPVAPPSAPRAIVAAASAGELCLNEVDEKTAALLMAIVADETKIPLSALRFKSIRQVPRESRGEQSTDSR